MRHALEAGDKENAGLAAARALLEPLQARHPGLSHADLWILAAYVAIEHTEGPRIRFTGGRQDAGPEKVPPNGRLPNPEREQTEAMNRDLVSKIARAVQIGEARAKAVEDRASENIKVAARGLQTLASE